MSITPISVIVLTHDEEANIAACLESVTAWAQEILVVDSGSKDRTLAIVANYTTKVFHHPFHTYSAQRNWAQAELPIQSAWLFHIDADERVSVVLAQEVIKLFDAGLADGPTVGLLVPRRIEFMGHQIKGGGLYPTYHCRIFRRGQGRCESREYDQHFVVDGPTHKLTGDLIEATASSLESWTRRHIRWAQLEARQLLASAGGNHRDIIRGSAFGTPIERRRWLRRVVYERMPLFARAFLYFLYRFLLRGGFRDGTPGLIYHVLQGFWFRFYIDACLYELRRCGHTETQESVAGKHDESREAEIPK